ncbi:MAG: flagellar biosynthetic protein FliO, partial [Hyphomicrobiales bacterium]|nr:flagellar biosynthetic protein FliO [Hyphomicrobiales bacterium]
MQWLNDLPFADNRVLQIGFLAACGIAALIVLAIFYRLTFAHRLRVPGGRTRQPRLGLVDAFSLDGQRQLVLVRRDNIEHLVMIGGPNDVLVESQINRAAAPARESSQVSPLLVPSAPARRTEPAAAVAPPAAAEAPAKPAAKTPSSPPSPPPPSPLPVPPPSAPAAPVPTAPVAAVLVAPTAAPSVPKAPAPAEPTAPVPSQASIP